VRSALQQACVIAAAHTGKRPYLKLVLKPFPLHSRFTLIHEVQAYIRFARGSPRPRNPVVWQNARACRDSSRHRFPGPRMRASSDARDRDGSAGAPSVSGATSETNPPSARQSGPCERFSGANVLHKDVKPSNILVDPDCAQERRDHRFLLCVNRRGDEYPGGLPH